MYYCELQTDQTFYGNVYNELSKRRAVVISEDLHEISNVFIIKAYLPVVEVTFIYNSVAKVLFQSPR